MGSDELITNVVQYLDTVFLQLDLWHQQKPPDARGLQPWFRGEPVSDRPLLPRLYRRRPPYPELDLLYHFRNMAIGQQFNTGINREATDLWLMLAQHVGLPTRLLDWTEGALIALFFAVSKPRPARVWMLVPQVLNLASGMTSFDVPWHSPTRTASAIRAAWQNEEPEEPDLPVALYPMHVHPRLQVQHSCFTIHGRRKEGLDLLLKEAGLQRYLRAFEIDPTRHSAILDELRFAGITQATLFPDLGGVAADLTRQFWLEGNSEVGTV